jgi:pumilio RNA-binding family
MHPTAHQIILLFLAQGSSEEQLLITQLSLRGKMSSLSFHTHGCRVVQKAISCLPKDLAEALANELDEGLLARCVEDSNANHVLSVIASELAPDSVPSLYRFAKNAAKQLAAHPYGCRLVQRILEKKSAHSKEVATILLEHVVLLSTDSFG